MATVERARVLPAICGLLAGPVLLVATVAGALALAFGIGTIVAAVAGSAVGEGLASLLAVLVWFIWIAVLAIRMLRLAPGGGVGGPARSPVAPGTHA